MRVAKPEVANLEVEDVKFKAKMMTMVELEQLIKTKVESNNQAESVTKAELKLKVSLVQTADLKAKDKEELKLTLSMLNPPVMTTKAE